jgi:hypothetical protein
VNRSNGQRNQPEPSALLPARSSELLAGCDGILSTHITHTSHASRLLSSSLSPHTSHIHRTLLVSSPPPFLNTSSLPAPVIKCPGGLLIPSPSALALCSTLLLFLSFFFSPSFSLHLTPSPLAVATSPFSAVIKQKVHAAGANSRKC